MSVVWLVTLWSLEVLRVGDYGLSVGDKSLSEVGCFSEELLANICFTVDHLTVTIFMLYLIGIHSLSTSVLILQMMPK